FGAHREPIGRVEDRRQAGANEGVVVDNENPDDHASSVRGGADAPRDPRAHLEDVALSARVYPAAELLDPFARADEAAAAAGGAGAAGAAGPGRNDRVGGVDLDSPAVRAARR